MTYDYDALYRDTPNALGEPTKDIVNYIKGLGPTPLKVLDIGCGQGRDALFIARLGHSVLGVDWSPSGIRCMETDAQREGLDVKGVVADIRNYTPDSQYDLLLIDRTLHMLSPDEQSRVLGCLLDSLAQTAWVVIADERKNFPRFQETLEANSARWDIQIKSRGPLIAERA